MQNNHKVLFSISLSNGETLVEEKGNFVTVPGERSPLLRMKAYIQKTGAQVTSVSLYTRDGKRWNAPSAGKNPKFEAFTLSLKPVSFDFYRKMGMDVNLEGDTANEEIYSVVEATYENGLKLQLWVNNETFASWVLVT